ncbi:MAG: hypothetical protein Q4D83_05435 [Corynebacterium sp.]|nr:hypothetical protein [Corynebacterium sp.]
MSTVECGFVDDVFAALFTDEAYLLGGFGSCGDSVSFFFLFAQRTQVVPVAFRAKRNNRTPCRGAAGWAFRSLSATM